MFRKVASIVLSFCMVVTLQLPTLAFADTGEGSEEVAADTVSGSYMQQSMAELYAAGDISVGDSSIDLAVDEASSTLVFSGGKKDMLASRITITKTFNFDENAVGRFMFAGSAVKGNKILLDFYLDDETDAFCTMQLAPQATAGSWADPTAKTVSIVAKGIKGEHTLSIGVNSCSSDPSFCLQYVEFCESSVPVVNINIDESLGTVDAMNNSDEHTDNCYGTMAIEVPEGCESCMGISADEFVGTGGDLEMEYMRGRGNSTWHVAKKPYKFKLKKGANLLGMGKNKHWALMANAYDSSMVHNIMTSILAEKAGMDYSPYMEPVELIINGEYYGCYMLSEVTRLDDNRVDITDQDDDDADASDITGGYLLSLGNWTLDLDKRNFTTTKSQSVFQIESPDTYSKTDSAQYDYIKNYVESVEEAIYSHDEDAYSNLMDLTEAAKYFWVEELSKNGDGYTSGSCYLYKDKDGGVHDGKLCWGPVWDFDLAWGDEENLSGAVGFTHTTSSWNEELFKDQAYVDVVKAQWPAFKAAMEALYEDGGVLDTLYSRMWIAAGYDYEKWQGAADERTDGDDWGEDSDPVASNSFSVLKDKISQCKTWLRTRAKWVDTNLETLDPVEVDVKYMVSGKLWKTIKEYSGRSLSSLPTAPTKAGYTFAHWNYKFTRTFAQLLAEIGVTEEEYRTSLIENEDYTPAAADAYIAELKKNGEVEQGEAYEGMNVGPNMVMTAKYIKSSSIPTVTKVYTLQNTIYCVYRNGEEYLNIDYETAPFDVQENNNGMSFTSSNPSVVRVLADGELLTCGAGDATITITPKKGVSGKVKVHIYTEAEYEAWQAKYIQSDIHLSTKKITIKKGAYAQLSMAGFPKGGIDIAEPTLGTSDDGIVQVGRCGVIKGLKCGTTTICCYNDQGNLSTCKVTVVDGKTHVGDVVKCKGMRYKVTSAVKGARTVSCLGPVSKKLKTATTLNYITIKGLKYKVTKVAAGAFKGCTKLRKMVLGTNIQIVGANAFKNCQALRKVIIRSQLKPKFYGSTFKNVGKKAVFWVHKSQKKYFKIVLSGRKVCGY